MASRPQASDPSGKQSQQRDLRGRRRHQSQAEPSLCQRVPGQEGAPQPKALRRAPGTDTSSPYRTDGSMHMGEAIAPSKPHEAAGGMASWGAEGVNHGAATFSCHKNVSDLPSVAKSRLFQRWPGEQSSLSQASPAPGLCPELGETRSCHPPPGEHRDPSHCTWRQRCSGSHHAASAGPCPLPDVGCLCRGGDGSE